MSLLFKRGLGDTLSQLTPARSVSNRVGMVPVTIDSALRVSAVWACLRLRSSLISTMPVDCYRLVDGVQASMPSTPFLLSPGGPDVPRHEWLQASQIDLDRTGNAFGIVTGRDPLGRPAQVDLVPFNMVWLRIQSGKITQAKVDGTNVAVENLWHERQMVVPGIPVGLSTVAYSAMSLGGYLSAQQFALDWFGSGAHPSGHLKNTQQDMLSQEVIAVAKARFKAASAQRDVFVSGSDWDFTPGAADAAQAAFLDEMRYGISDICRFYDVPADLLGAEDPGASGSKIIYANMTQRNLQFLIMHLGPAVIRREFALSAAIPAPRFVKFNTDALLRMDPAAVTANLVAQVQGRLRAPSEARDLLNLPPLTESQMAEFDRLFGSPNAKPAATAPAIGGTP